MNFIINSISLIESVPNWQRMVQPSIRYIEFLSTFFLDILNNSNVIDTSFLHSADYLCSLKTRLLSLKSKLAAEGPTISETETKCTFNFNFIFSI